MGMRGAYTYIACCMCGQRHFPNAKGERKKKWGKCQLITASENVHVGNLKICLVLFCFLNFSSIAFFFFSFLCLQSLKGLPLSLAFLYVTVRQRPSVLKKWCVSLSEGKKLHQSCWPKRSSRHIAVFTAIRFWHVC